MPISLLANIQSVLDNGTTSDQLRLNRDLLTAVMKLNSALRAVKEKTDEEARGIVFSADVVEPLLQVSKCPDLIVNRGHYFGAEGLNGRGATE